MDISREFSILEKDPCHPNPCRNNGKCSHDGNGKIECVCPERFKGTRCEGIRKKEINDLEFGR